MYPKESKAGLYLNTKMTSNNSLSSPSPRNASNRDKSQYSS